MTTIGLVTIDDEPVTQQQRALVAALALHRREGATTEMLIDALWDGRAPTSARKSVQNQVARLRQTFGPDLIRTTANRYRLRATTDIDVLDQLDQLTNRSALTAAEEYRFSEALAAWSGEPYADLIETPQAQAEQARLEFTRARLVEILAVSRLSRWATGGVDPATIVDLTVRTSTHPLHERAWELLVAALHLCGRRTEALGAYEDFRSALDQQLGVEPSPDFKRLRMLVAADRVLDTAHFFDPPGDAPAAPVLVSA